MLAIRKMNVMAKAMAMTMAMEMTVAMAMAMAMTMAMATCVCKNLLRYLGNIFCTFLCFQPML